MNDALGTSVELRRNCFGQRRDLRNAHGRNLHFGWGRAPLHHPRTSNAKAPMIDGTRAIFFRNGNRNHSASGTSKMVCPGASDRDAILTEIGVTSAAPPKREAPRCLKHCS